MRELVDAGQYERVNIVELLTNHFDMPRDAFERLIVRYRVYQLTHYNLDVIFSGDQELIESYYSIENEVAHSAKVQAALSR
jgi:hypothetical protein